MPKIVVVVRDANRKSDLISCIRRLTGLGVSAITDALVGKKPLGQWILFGNNHDEIARILRGLQDIAVNGHGVFSYFELQDDELFDQQASQRLEISPAILSNLLNAYDVERRKIDEE
jgi:hypothetical protein